MERLRWARSWTTPTALGSHTFKGMGNVVHVLCVCFNLCKDKQRYYVHDGEDPPSRMVQHKNHVTRVMFLGAVVRPRRTHYNKKIGIYPFTTKVRAQRNSRNRVAGTTVTKSAEVTKESYKKMLLDTVIPDIKSRFPRPSARASPQDRIVWVQQDNARPHLGCHVCRRVGDIRLVNQPANSPDTF
ncbi:unnamed protein product [Pylaiella littoralis]